MVQKRIPDIIDLIPDMVWEMDLNYVCLYASPGGEKMLGFTANELIGRRPFDFMTVQEGKRFHRAISSLVSKGKPLLSMKATVLNKEGQEVFVEISGVPIFDTGGKIVGYRGIQRDITYQHLLEREVRRSGEVHRNVFENAAIGIFQATASGRLALANHCLSAFLGYESPEELIENVKSVGQQLYVNEQERADVFRMLHGTGFVRNVCIQAYRKDGDVIDVLLNVDTVQSLGEGVVYEGTALDITEQKFMKSLLTAREHELALKNQNIKEMNTALNVLVRQIDHDRRNGELMVAEQIGQVIIPYIEKLRKGTLHPEQVTYLDIIETNLRDLCARKSDLPGIVSSLSLTERQVVDLIKHGKTGKEMAEILAVSLDTINFHRQNIRRKLGLKGKKINLRMYILNQG